MTLKFDVGKMRNGLVFALLFLAAMNFQSKFFYYVFLSLFVVVLSQKKLMMDYSSLVYLALSTLMAVYNHDEGLLSMIRCFAPFCFYLVGLNLVFDSSSVKLLKEYEPKRVQEQGYTLLVVVSLGAFTHYIANYIYNIGNNIGRNTVDIWTGQGMAATGQNALACLMLGLSTAMLYLPLKKWHRYAAICCILIMLSYNLILASRTMIAILCSLLLIGLLYPKMKEKTLSQTIQYVVGGLVFLVLVVVFYILNIGGIQEYIHDSYLFNRIDGTLSSLLDNSTRNNIKQEFLKEMWKYPLGGLHLRRQFGNYAHDLLLDGYDEYGIGALVLLIIILIMGAAQLFRLLREASFEKRYKLPLLLIYISMLLEFTVEPILAGMPWLFACYSLFNGCMVGMNYIVTQSEKQRIWRS